jgi:DNA-binding XRE family transcriptional regulator
MAIGAINNGAKLTEQQVLEIRRLYSEGGITQQSLGLQFGVARECITAIVNRKNWTHI